MGDDVRELIRREPSQAEHDAIRELWKRHSVAEDNRDLPGLLATLTEDCVYELVQTGHRWEGHEGAARFYGGAARLVPGHPLPADEHRDRARRASARRPT